MLRALRAASLSQQIGKHFFRAEMASLKPVQFLFRLNAGSNGHEAVEAARVDAAIFILCAVIHRFRLARFHDARRSLGSLS
jgi:hypothetical protein